MILGTLFIGLTEACARMSAPITEGLTGGELQLRFESAAWEGLTKRIFFKAGSVSRSVTATGETAVIPWEVTQKSGKMVQAGVIGTDGENIIIPTVWAFLGNVQRAAEETDQESLDPTLPAWAQIQQIALDLEARANRGDFDGAPGPAGPAGKNGGYYTPGVSQPDANTIQFDATPSQAGMPAVEPVRVTLPVSTGTNLELDTTLTQRGKAADAKAVGDAISKLSGGNLELLDPEDGEVFTVTGGSDSGEDTHTHSYTSEVTTEATCTTAGVRTYTCECGDTYTEQIPVTGHNYENGVCTNCGVADPDYEEDVTLSSISATYSGGNVGVGTAVTDLTGITVTANYSDGSTATVTDYTLSGEIAEGSNTITVSYGGMTTTFTVTGVEEENGDTPEDFTGTENAFERDGYLYVNPLMLTPMFNMNNDSDMSDYHRTIYSNNGGKDIFDNSALSDGTIFNGVVKQTASSTDEPYYEDAGNGNAWFYIPLDDWNNAGGSIDAYLYSLTARFPIKLASVYNVFDFNNSDMGTIVQGSKYKTDPSISNGFIVGDIFFAMDINWHPVCNVNGFTFTSGETECYNIAPYASGWTTFSFSIPSTAFDNDLNNVSIASIVEYVRSIGLKFWGGAA